ncbi:complement C1q-like protein 4 [Alosa sapidissima]|uniref:complement C1q-like protein 4 n=1 Tax=Alosa sapidissima TaxID=34773 RepID=UPI001C0A3A9E|nr:complement C1q-like protein 4 [Alosa sapidissima]
MEIKAVLMMIISLICLIRPIQSNGGNIVDVTKPMTVHFYAAHPYEIKGRINIIRFSDVILNEGFAFSGKTGIFTAPVNGIYQFFYSFHSHRGNANNHWHLRVNGVVKALCHSQVRSGSTVGSMCTYMTELAKNDAQNL